MTSQMQHRVRPSFSSHASGRRYSAFAGIENGDSHTRAAGAATEHNIEELEEIKRYEDFTTVDWVQDAAREQLRRRARRNANAGKFPRKGRWAIRQKLWEMYDAGQAWIVVTIVGAVIGLIAAVLNIITEWLSDIKLGHCTTAFYLNESFCCWGVEEGCDEWVEWSGFLPFNYVVYFVFSVLFAFTAASLVKSFAPYASGSGISEIKCIIAGFVMKGFLGFWTLLIKAIALPLAIASGLSVGKEGPTVHYAVCTGNVISQFFDNYKRNRSKVREILTACSAAGVAVAFGSPIGGVLFSLEEMSSHFPLKTLWRSYFCALVATSVLAAMNPFRTGQLVMFQVHYDRSWHFFEVIPFILIGIFGGLFGAFVIKWNLRAQSFRKKHLSKFAVPEVVILAGITAILCYPNMFLRIDMTESMEILFRECEADYDYNGICEVQNRWKMVFSLAMAVLLRTFLLIISYGSKVPAGIFVPPMAIGATFGRLVGILVQAVHESMPNARIFSACEPDVPCITPGTFAFLGAASALSGVMHITVSVVVIMFELTGALTYIVPTMIVVGVTKIVSSYFTPGGIADRMIYFNGFPFLDTKEEHAFHVPVSTTMTPASNLSLLPAHGMTLSSLEDLLDDSRYSGFPVVSDLHTRVLLGYVGRTELMYAIEKAKNEKRASKHARCIFSENATQPLQTPSELIPAVTFDDIDASDGDQTIDFSRFMDPSPLAVHPHQPLETVLELFKKMGPRVILVEHKGRLVGLVTVKDCLKYQFQIEAQEREEHGETETKAAHFEEALWSWMQIAGGYVSECTSRLTRGKIRLGSGEGRGENLFAGPSADPRDEREEIRGTIEDGHEEIANGVELDDR